jgi:N-methylhydantoinase A/oxoprolinase/acetone carboxylase beta subunit
MSRIGIDVGGTNTDTVLLVSGSVIHSVKTPITLDITAGILTALMELVRHPKVLLEAIDGVVIGTTHFVNAILQRRDLARCRGAHRLAGERLLAAVLRLARGPGRMCQRRGLHAGRRP